MPIIRPEIQKALRAAGLADKEGSSTLTQRLDSNNLSIDTLLEQLSDIVQGGETSLRLRAIDTGLKLHKVLNDKPDQMPQISIVIHDKFATESSPEINPIFIPRSNSVYVKEITQ
jgi:hypothetical protein